MQGVRVVATNTTGSYSNAAYTEADGSYSIPLDLPEYYVQFLDPVTVPTNATPIYPPTGIWVFTLNPDQDVVVSDYLISSPACVSSATAEAFWLRGNASIRTGKGRSDHSVSGSVQPDCQPASGPGGTWNDTAHLLKLTFRGTVSQTVRAGIAADSSSYLEFQGTGTLKGLAGNKVSYPEVSFFCHLEDRTYVSQPDLYYLRVFNSAGATLMLVSGDPANPLNVAPIPITSGDLRISVGTCANPPR